MKEVEHLELQSLENTENIKQQYKIRQKQLKNKIIEYKERNQKLENELQLQKQANEEIRQTYEQQLQSVQSDLIQAKQDWDNKNAQLNQENEQSISNLQNKY